MHIELKSWWWKILSLLLLGYTFYQGFMGPVPSMPILNESIRNLYFHVTMWMGMMILMLVNTIYSIRFLSKMRLRDDLFAVESARASLIMGAAGLITGMVWANYTWGAPWVNDPQLNGTAATLLIYAAYFILRNSIPDREKRARLASVYSIFAFAMMIVFIMVLPKMTDSLHPGKGGNPGFNKYDLDSAMRAVFYPAIIGWTLLAVWMMNLRVRMKTLENNLINE